MRNRPGLVTGPRENCLHQSESGHESGHTTNKGYGDSGGCISYRVPHIFVMSADGSDETRFLDIPAAQPNWSPDGVTLSRFLGFLRILSELSRTILAVRCLVQGGKPWRLTHRGTDEDEKSVQQTAQAPRT